MSILGEHPQSISEKSLSYLLDIIKVEGDSIMKLSGLTIIHQMMINDPTGDVRAVFLRNGLLEWILTDFDAGFHSEENTIYLDISLNILWNLSKLAVCPVQPLICDTVIRRLISMFDVTSPFYSFPSNFTTTLRDLCENKHLVGHVSSNLVSVKVKDDIRIATTGKLKNLKKFPEEIQICALYDTNDPENEVNITSNLISHKLAWPLKHNSDHEQNLEEGSEDSWKDILVTEVIGGPYFWAHVGIETIETVRQIQNLLLLEYSTERLIHTSCNKDDLIVIATAREGELCFFRAQVIKQKLEEVKVWALDYGFVLDVSSGSVYKMPASLDLPPQIHLCCVKGIQPGPRDPVLLNLTASILCTLTQKSLPAGDIIMNLDGCTCLTEFIKICEDQNIIKEVLKLITNLSFGERKRKKWLETEVIPYLLEKLTDRVNIRSYTSLLYCLSNLIIRCPEARAKFYHSQGIDIVLTVIMTCPGDGSIYKACVHLLKTFVQRLNTENTDRSTTSSGKFISPTPKHASEMNRLMAKLEEPKLQEGEIQCSISEDRLEHDVSGDDTDEEIKSSFEKKPKCVSSDEIHPMCQNPDSVAVNVCVKGFGKKRYYIKDAMSNIESDSLHELRPHQTLANVSSSAIATHVCGMLNNRRGGQIIFGISKTSKIQGVKASRDDRDEFRLGVDRMMTDKLSPGVLHSLFDMEYYPVVVENQFEGEVTPLKDLFVIIIHVKASRGTLYTVKKENKSYIRYGSCTSPLSMQDLRNLVILEEEDRYRSQIIELQQKLKQCNQTC